MTKKFDSKSFCGKLVWVSVPNQRGIRRRFAWHDLKRRYEDPLCGPIYEARRVAGRGKNRVSRTFGALQPAIEWKDRRSLEPIDQSLVHAPPKAEYSVGQLIKDFRTKRFSFLSEGTVIIYERLFSSFAPLTSCAADSLTPRHVSEWVDWLKSPARAAESRPTRISFEKELGLLGVLLRWHIEENDDSTLVFPVKRKHFERAQVRKRSAKKFILSEAELSTWLNALRTWDPLFYALAFVQVAQALRVSEVAAMKWNNLDLSIGRYEIREHLVWPRVGGRPPALHQGTKTQRDSHWIPLWAEVQTLLTELLKSKSASLIFTKTGEPLQYRQIQHAYDRAFAKVGLPHRGTHVCRHTGSTMFLDKTQDLLALQQLGGWKDQHMPQHYAKVRAHRAEKAMRESERRLTLVKADNEACF